MTSLSHAADEYPPGLVLRAALALDFMAFTEFAFAVVRPNTLFKPQLAPRGPGAQAVSGCLRRGQAADRHHAAAESEIAVRLGGAAGLVSRP